MKLRMRERDLDVQQADRSLAFHESTYHYSSPGREKAFIAAQFPTTELLERYRSYRCEWHRRSAMKDAGDGPLAVIIELVSTCNLRCEMCYTRTPEFQDAIIGAQRMMPWDTVTRLVDECADIGVHSILFSWRGASSLYRSRGGDGVMRDFADALQYARRREILEVTSLTHGRSLDTALIERIVKAQPNWISFSIDGMDDAYDSIRGSIPGEQDRTPFAVVFENLKKMVTIRDGLGLKLPQIRTNTIYPAIANDPERYRRLMEEAGVGLVTVNELLDFRGAELPDDAIAENWFCQYPFQRLVVSANGAILPCPGAHNEEESVLVGRFKGSPEKRVNDNGTWRIVDTREMTLMEAWKSDTIQNIRELHRSGRRTEIDACKHCRHGAKTNGVDWIPDDWDMDRMQWGDRSWRNG